jgi:hypothetical protein
MFSGRSPDEEQVFASFGKPVQQRQEAGKATEKKERQKQHQTNPPISRRESLCAKLPPKPQLCGPHQKGRHHQRFLLRETPVRKSVIRRRIGRREEHLPLGPNTAHDPEQAMEKEDLPESLERFAVR